MTINWQNLRIWNGSQHTGFEELCCQLAFYEAVPICSQWERRGTPDGGVECLWVLPDGKKWGWQSKFFLSSPNDGQWAQIDDSVKTALEKHPELSLYTVCLPCDRPDPKIKDKSGKARKSFMDRWKERVILWEGWAEAKNMTVVFQYWGESEIAERLARTENAGRYKFWLERDFLSDQWFRDRLRVVVADAEPRYTPEINVALPLTEHFHGLARTPQFFQDVATRRGKLRQAWGDFARSFGKSPNALKFSGEFVSLQRDVERTVELLAHGGAFDDSSFEWDAIETLTENVDSLWSNLNMDIGVLSPRPNDKSHQDQNEVAILISSLRKVGAANTGIYRLARTPAAQLSSQPFFLLQGSAGQGKTHLFCDVARQLIGECKPCVVLLGEKFSSGDPWLQIIQTLGLNCNRDEFLGALETAAQATGGRALIFIDALNEGEGKTLWRKHLAGFIEELKRFPRVGLALSVRSTYADMVIPPQAIPQLIKVEHPGFAGHEYKATETFFDHYKIKRPAVPLLSPEWSNPLFLKLFCQGLQNAKMTELPTGWHGVTQIFGFFLKATNEKLAETLDFDKKDDLVEAAAFAVVAEMTSSGSDWLDRGVCRDIVDGFLPGRTFQNSLFRHLLAEGVLAEENFPTWPNKSEGDYGEMVSVEGVRIGFERFSDHLRARNILDQEFDPTQPQKIFEPPATLGQIYGTRNAIYQHKGLLEALAIQIPERCSRELPDLLPQFAGEDEMQEVFVESLLWRDPKAITEETRRYINEQVAHGRSQDKLWGVFLMLAPRPGHPYNADFLHRNLWKRSMVERDAWWSIYLHQNYDSQGPLDRLIDWAQSEEDKSYLDDESARLCAVALSWCLTTSHRFVRDRATKGIVALLSSRLPVLLQLQKQFKGVNDDYVRERLLAIAYGCCLRSSDSTGVEALARYVFAQVFESPHEKGQEVWPHVLGRDYARGVVEVAIHRGLIFGDEAENMVKLARPPYNSAWPTQFPTKAEFEKLMGDNNSLAFSLSDLGDFKRYQIESSLGHSSWSSLRLKEPLPPTLEERFASWFAELSPERQRDYEAHQERLSGFAQSHRSDLDRALKKVYFDADTNEDSLENLPDEVIAGLDQKISISYGDDAQERESLKTLERRSAESEAQFLATLSDNEQEEFEREARPYLQYPYQTDVPFDPAPLRYWIAQKVFDLGWTKERFENFDRMLHYHTGDRNANKSERIGKKYQWIALHEIAARVADNFYMKDRYGWSETGKRRIKVFDGPWSPPMRDLDPSFSLRSTHDEGTVSNWWAPWSYPNWNAIEDHETWVQTYGDLPSLASLIEVVHPKDGSRWLSLGLLVRAREPEPPGEDRFRGVTRLWQLYINAYLVKKQDERKLWAWAKKQDFQGGWMPDGYTFDEAMWGEVPWANAFVYNDADRGQTEWTREAHGVEKMPVPILPPVNTWQHGGGDYDCSMDEAGGRLSIPCCTLIETMKLRAGRDGEWLDESGKLVAFDPTARETGPGTLLIHCETFEAFLEAEGLALFWTVQGEKQIMVGMSHFPKMLELNAALRLKKGELEEHLTSKVRQIG